MAVLQHFHSQLFSKQIIPVKGLQLHGMVRVLPPNEVGEVDDPGQAGCLRPQKLHSSKSYCAWHKSVEATRPKRVVNETETSDNGVEVAACRMIS